MRTLGLIGTAFGLLAGAASGCRNAEPTRVLRALIEDEARAASPAATETMVAVSRISLPTRCMCGRSEINVTSSGRMTDDVTL